ncbi:MAG: 50S ribosomal protein L25/general stress protein Ctc [Pseudomonadota bacterium]
MSDITVLPAEARDRAGKGSARAARREGRVPGVVYGSKKAPAMITLERKELFRQLRQPGFYARLFDIDLDGKKDRVLARDVQFHPVSDVPLHIDFLRVSATTAVTVAVPVVFTNEEECPGLVGGGVLNVVRHELDLNCRADAIPPQIEIDLSGLEVGDGVHISMVNLPDGVEPTITDRDFTIATIAAPVVHVEEEPGEDDPDAEIEGLGDAPAGEEAEEAPSENSDEG